jgi:DNA repair exonuclease SbcCD ATPase subunit
MRKRNVTMVEKRGSVPTNTDMKKTKEKEVPEFKRKSVMIDNKMPMMKASRANKDSIHKTRDSQKNIFSSDSSKKIEVQKTNITEIESELKKYKEKYEKKKKKKKKLEENLKDKEKEISSLKAEIENYKKLSGQQDKPDKIDKKEHEKIINMKDEEIKRIKEEKSKLSVELEQKENKHSLIVEDLKSNEEKLKKEKNELNLKLKEVNDENKKLKDEIES